MSRRSDWKTGVEGRIERAMTQRMYVMSARGENFKVMGSTGTPYTIKVTNANITCTCPDHTQRHSTCKHMMFLVGRVGRNREMLDRLVRNRYATVRESGPQMRDCIREGFVALRGAIPDEVDVEEGQVGTGHAAAVPKESPKKRKAEVDRRGNESCPVCFEDFAEDGDDEKKPFCSRQCGTEFHGSCIRMWVGKHPTCPMCRAAWVL